jgi:nicotinamidase-related amidase
MIDVPALPYSFTLDPARAALVVIDMQRDFIEHGGFGEALGNDVTRLQAIIPAVAEIIGLFRAKGWPILHTRECHLPDLSNLPPAKRARGKGAGLRIGDEGPMGRLLIRGEKGAEIITACTPLAGEMVIDKPGKGMFCNTDVETMLRARGITHIVFTGVTTEVCVQTSMREANDRGFECLLVTDCTESYFPEYKAAVVSMVTAQGGIVGWTTELAALKAACG